MQSRLVIGIGFGRNNIFFKGRVKIGENNLINFNILSSLLVSIRGECRNYPFAFNTDQDRFLYAPLGSMVSRT